VTYQDEILGRSVTALERAADALERLAEDPVIEMETGPPVCPHCETINPTVRVEESSAQGKLGEFVIQAHCLHCNSVIYALPVQWQCVKTTDEAGEILREMEEIRGHGFNGGAHTGAPPGSNAAGPGDL